MSKFILCGLRHASNLINGIAFEDHAEGKISADPVEDAVAENFAAIPGYEIRESKDAKTASGRGAGGRFVKKDGASTGGTAQTDKPPEQTPPPAGDTQPPAGDAPPPADTETKTDGAPAPTGK